MHLNILWNNNHGATVAATNKQLLAENMQIESAPELDKALEYLEWMNVLVAGNPDEKLLDAPNLKYVIVPFVGINENLRKNILARPHLKLYNSHFNSAFVAQHAVALLLAASNRIIKADQSLKKGNWAWGEENKSISLKDKTCLLLGYGAIAKDVEKTARALGMNISIIKRKFVNVENATVFSRKDLHKALNSADVVIVSLPLTAETENILDRKAFAAMKKEAILVNVGRGKLIDQYALYDALKNKQIFAAGIDVWWNYPKQDEKSVLNKEITLPSDAALEELDNIIMSSHRANNVHGWELVAFKDVLLTLTEIAKGQERNSVNAKRGY